MNIQELKAIVDQIAPSGRAVLDVAHVVFSSIFDVLLYLLLGMTIFYIIMALSQLLFKNTIYVEKPLSKKAKLPFVTIQIPTYNELAALECARRCLAFDYPKNKFEIAIGDDSNDKEISKQIAQFAKQNPQVTVYKREKNVGYKPGNLNNMLPHANGDYLLIFDSDYLPEPDFLQRMVAVAVQNPELAGVQARWKVCNQNQNLTTALGTAGVNAFHLIILPFISRFSPTVNFCGSAELVRKDLLVENGGWRTGALTEDIEYTFRAISAGYRIQYVPTISCDNEAPQTPRDLFKQQMRWAFGVCRSFMDHGSKLFGKKTSLRIKTMAVIFGSGYFMTSVMALLMVFGALAILTHPPAPIDFAAFAKTTAFNFLLTSGLLISTLAATIVSTKSVRRNIIQVKKVLIASYTIGFVVLFFVTRGIYKALTGQTMQWFMLKKNGNLKA